MRAVNQAANFLLLHASRHRLSTIYGSNCLNELLALLGSGLENERKVTVLAKRIKMFYTSRKKNQSDKVRNGRQRREVNEDGK